MKPGLRLQILMILGILMAAAFAPLYLAVSTYTEVALERATQVAARSQVEGLLHRAEQSHRGTPPPSLPLLLDQQTQGGTFLAIAAYDAQGVELARSAPGRARNELPASFDGQLPEPTRTDGTKWVLSRGPTLSLLALLPERTAQARNLSQLLALYMSLIAVALLSTVYFAITRWIIRPIGELSLAARRVANTTRELVVPTAHSRELAELSESLQTMTERLSTKELALEKKVTELERARTDLTRAQAQLVHSERLASVGQLAAGLAHEVGNPITAMQGLQDLILSGDLNEEEQRDFVQRMRKETERIHRILRDLLAFARPRSEHSESNEPGSVEAAAHETIALLLPQPLLRHVELVLDIFPDLPNVALPHEQLTQVLLNLLLNAAQACQDGGTVRLDARVHDGTVRVTVTDNGVGVPSDLAERIFEPFVSSKDVGEGSGLGLSVCRGLVDAVGGSIFLDEAHEKGARFVVDLPPHVANPEPTNPERHEDDSLAR